MECRNARQSSSNEAGRRSTVGENCQQKVEPAYASQEVNPTPAGRVQSTWQRLCGRLLKTAVSGVVTASVLSFLNINTAIISTQSWCMLATYILMVSMSPGWKHITEPLVLRQILGPYNILCSALSTFTAGAFTYGLLVDGDSVFSLQSSRSTALQIAFQVYHYTKILELLDTVWMILRHRFRQISLLHVFHHSTMLLLSDYAYHELWPAFSAPLGMNSYIHILLYFYYWKTGSGQAQPSWRRRLTEMQILQFLIGLLHAAIGYSSFGFCPYSVFYGLSLLLLFSQFYYTAYLKPGHVDARNDVSVTKKAT